MPLPRSGLASATAPGPTAKDARRVAGDPRVKDHAVHDHCLPAHLSHARAVARGSPRSRTAAREPALWAAVQS